MKLSICIPTYNHAKYLKHNLESLLPQLGEGMEVVISDNASTDDTKAVVEEFSHRFPAVTYHRWPENMGADRNYLKVIELARGEYCWLFGSDDAVRPGAVRQVLAMLGEHTDICLFSRFNCSFDMVPTGPKYWLKPDVKERVFNFSDARDLHLYLQKSIALGALFSYLSSIVVRREAWNSVTYDERYTGTAYSHAFILLSLVQQGCTLYYSPKALVDCRLGNDSFAGHGVARRILLDFDGYCAIRDQLFEKDTVAQEGINHVLHSEYQCHVLMNLQLNLSVTDRTAIVRALQRVKYPRLKLASVKMGIKFAWLLKPLRSAIYLRLRPTKTISRCDACKTIGAADLLVKKNDTSQISDALHIGVDARPLATPHSGIGRYTMSLLHEFASQPMPHRIFLYSDRPFQLEFTLPQHWTIRSGSGNLRGLGATFAQVIFPFWAMKDGIDVFWSPRHHLPILLAPHVKKVITVHDLVWRRFPQTMRRGGSIVEALLMPISLRLAHHVIAVSQFTRTEILAFYPATGSKIGVIYEASSLKAEGVTGPCPFSKPYFLFVGSNEPRKNLERLLQAYLEYRGICSHPVDLAIAGTDQWGDFNVHDYIRKNDLEPWVHLIHNVDDSILRSLYAHAQALVMVSIYEGFGLPLVEAMQWNVPLIASCDSAVAEIADDAALRVDPRNIDAIAQALRQMTEDRAMRSRLTENARIRGQQFTWKEAASQTMSILVGDLAVTK